MKSEAQHRNQTLDSYGIRHRIGGVFSFPIHRLDDTGWVSDGGSEEKTSGVSGLKTWLRLVVLGTWELRFFYRRNTGSQTLDVLYMVELANISSRFRTNFWVEKCR